MAGRFRIRETAFEVMERAVIGAFKRSLVAGKFADAGAALAIPNVGVGDWIRREGGRLGLGFRLAIRIGRLIGTEQGALRLWVKLALPMAVV